MKRFLALLLIAALLIPNLLSAGRTGWNFPVGVAYSDSYRDLIDTLKDKNLDVTSVPVGLTFQPYAQFDNGFGVGAAIGPFFFISGDDLNSFVLPMGIDGRYIFNKDNSFSQYVRAGGRFPLIGGGDVLAEGRAGYFLAVGVEYFADPEDGMGWGLEISTDTSEVELEFNDTTTQNIKASELVFSIYMIF